MSVQMCPCFVYHYIADWYNGNNNIYVICTSSTKTCVKCKETMTLRYVVSGAGLWFYCKGMRINFININCT